MGLLTGPGGFRPPRICCPRVRYLESLHNLFELETFYAAVGIYNLQNHSWRCRQLMPERRKTQTHQNEPIFLFKMVAVLFVLDAVLRRIGFSAPRCSIFRSRRQLSSRIRLGKEFLLDRGAMRNSCRQFAPMLRQNLARCFGRNFGSNFNPRDFPENLRSVSMKVVGCFLCICLYRFLQRRPSNRDFWLEFISFL